MQPLPAAMELYSAAAMMPPRHAAGFHINFCVIPEAYASGYPMPPPKRGLTGFGSAYTD